MKALKLIFLFLLLSIMSVKSQVSISDQNTLMNQARNVKDNQIFDKHEMIHELYLDDWSEGNIYPRNGMMPMSQFRIRYFVYNQEFHLISPQKDTVILSKSYAVDSILVSNKRFIYTNYKSNTKIRNSYFQELVGGKVKLLKRHSSIFVLGNKKTATGYQKAKPDSYKITTKLYYQDHDQNAILLPTKKSEIILLFENDKVANFIKENKLRAKKEKHLIKIFEYYNSLLPND